MLGTKTPAAKTAGRLWRTDKQQSRDESRLSRPEARATLQLQGFSVATPVPETSELFLVTSVRL
jgi:hypothetical protein